MRCTGGVAEAPQRQAALGRVEPSQGRQQPRGARAIDVSQPRSTELHRGVRRAHADGDGGDDLVELVRATPGAVQPFEMTEQRGLVERGDVDGRERARFAKDGLELPGGGDLLLLQHAPRDPEEAAHEPPDTRITGCASAFTASSPATMPSAWPPKSSAGLREPMPGTDLASARKVFMQK